MYNFCLYLNFSLKSILIKYGIENRHLKAKKKKKKVVFFWPISRGEECLGRGREKFGSFFILKMLTDIMVGWLRG